MTVGERIKEFRNAHGMTLRKFSARIGITNGALSQIESGRTTPSGQTIKSICREFGIREDWLRDGTGDMKAADTEQELEAAVARMLSGEDAEFRRRLVGVLTRLTPAQWAQFERYVKELAGEEAGEEAPPDEYEQLKEELEAEKKERGEDSEPACVETA